VQVENIGARRLHTVLERLVEDISFEAPDKVASAAGSAGASGNGSEVPAVASAALLAESDGPESEGAVCCYYRHVVDKEHVREKLADLMKQQDLDKYIL